MELIRVYRLALKAVERELDLLGAEIKANPQISKYLITEYDETAEEKKELVKEIARLWQKEQGNDGATR